MTYKFCTIASLHSSTRRAILKNMVYREGSMKDWIACECGYKLCLVYLGRKLVTWVCLIDYTDGSHALTAWTLKSYRRKGYARDGAKALLKRHKVTKKSTLLVYSNAMISLIDDLGHPSEVTRAELRSCGDNG